MSSAPYEMEQLDVSLYDTWDIGPGDVIAFFQSGGLDEERTNVPTAGALTYPKHFDVTGLALRFAKDMPADKLHVDFWIGEELVLSERLRAPGPAHAFDWPLLVEIPTVQCFRVVLRSNEPVASREKVSVRCSLLGALHRERR